MLAIYLFVLFLLSIFSYAQVDPNFTLVNHPLWTVFRNLMVDFGYFHRGWLTLIYFLFLGLLLFFNYRFTKSRYSPIKVAFCIALCLIVSYPFLSHDFFNYLFDAKIVTVYGKNPYLFKAMDFAPDPWIRFMHWTHRTYAYGPTFLPITLIPSFLSMGKLVLNYFFFKLMFAGFYLLAVWVIAKKNKPMALFFATSPLVVIEGLINNHNDLLGLSMGLIALYFSHSNRKYLAILFAGLSGGIKYFTVAFIPLVSKTKRGLLLALAFFALLLVYVKINIGIHPWYFLNLLLVLYLLKKPDYYFSWLGVGLLASYFPYLYWGGWHLTFYVTMKEIIIIVSVLLFAIFWLRKLKQSGSSHFLH